MLAARRSLFIFAVLAVVGCGSKTVAIDDKDANTSLAVRAEKATLLEMRGTVPVTIAELRANPQAVLGMPIDMIRRPAAPGTR